MTDRGFPMLFVLVTAFASVLVWLYALLPRLAM